MRLAPAIRALTRDLLFVDGAKILVVNVAGAGLAFVSHVLFARWLGVASYGTYVFALSWLSILFILIQAGMNLSMVRFIAEYRAQGNRAAMTAVVGFSNRVILILGACIAVAGWAVIVWTLPQSAEEMRGTLYGALALTVVMALIQQRTAVLQGLERVVQSTLVFEIARPLALLAAVFVLAQFAALDAALVMAVNLGVSLGVLIVLMAYARSSILAEPATNDRPAPSWRDWLKVSLPYVAVTGLTILLTQMDILMIGHILGTEQAGLYAPAAKVALLAIFPVVAVRARFGPMAAKLFAEGKTAELQSRMNVATLLSIAACTAMLVVILPGRSLILGLFGPDFLPGGEVVAILTLAYLAYSLMGAAEMFFLVGPFERMNAVVSALTLGINLVLNLILIPRFGIEGAAMATGAAMVIRAGISSAIICRRTGLVPWARTAGTHGARQ
ncbi:MAG: oligosaccharide flippase family protein [Alphaproteobacteria bacterium]